MRTRDWRTLTLLTGIAVLTGYLAGRDRPTPQLPPTGAATPQPAAPPDQPTAAVEVRPFAGVPADIGHHRLHPDVLLGPVLLVMIGIIGPASARATPASPSPPGSAIIGATGASMLAGRATGG